MDSTKIVTCKGGPLDGRKMRIHLNTESFTTHADPLGGSYVAKKTVATWVEKKTKTPEPPASTVAPELDEVDVEAAG